MVCIVIKHYPWLWIVIDSYQWLWMVIIGYVLLLILTKYVTRYEKIDHLQFFTKFAFLVWIDVKFTVEFNG